MLVENNTTNKGVKKEERGAYNVLEHPQQLWHNLCHFTTLKTYFIILPHYFTTSHLSDVL